MKKSALAFDKAGGAEILFWDESGFRADTVHGNLRDRADQIVAQYNAGKLNWAGIVEESKPHEWTYEA